MKNQQSVDLSVKIEGFNQVQPLNIRESLKINRIKRRYTPKNFKKKNIKVKKINKNSLKKLETIKNSFRKASQQQLNANINIEHSSHTSEISISGLKKADITPPNQPEDLFTRILFSPESLSQIKREQYSNNKKLSNTDLMQPGCKFIAFSSHIQFISNLYQRIKKWKTAIIFYQVPYNSGKDLHFGLLIKHNYGSIGFDGVQMFLPSFASKSCHWQQQNDEWSCGYRALFWYYKIVEAGGVQQWINKYQKDYYKIQRPLDH